MVSVRKAWRKLMGLSPGHGASLGPQLGLPNGSGTPARFPLNSVSVYPMSPSEAEQSPPVMHLAPRSSIMISKCIKRRKPHKRTVSHDRQPCLMRGVYFKNMKWQAAIKVDKKQIHLGTVETQEEAAHLYDRAAFMCGREPNFDISEEEKQDLMKLNWDEFLALTRHTINNKKHGRKRRQAGVKKLSAPPQLNNGDNNEDAGEDAGAGAGN